MKKRIVCFLAMVLLSVEGSMHELEEGIEEVVTWLQHKKIAIVGILSSALLCGLAYRYHGYRKRKIEEKKLKDLFLLIR